MKVEVRISGRHWHILTSGGMYVYPEDRAKKIVDRLKKKGYEVEIKK